MYTLVTYNNSPPTPQSTFFAIMAWVPLAIVAGICWIAGLKGFAIGVVGIGFLAHSLVRPRVSVYFVIAAIYAQSVLGSGVAGFQIAKGCAIWAVIVSIPLLLRSLSGHIDRTARWILAFVGLAVLTIPLSPNPVVTAKLVVSLLSNYGLAFLLCLHLKERKHYNAALVATFLISGVMAIYYIMSGKSDVVGGRAALASVVGGAEFSINTFARLLTIGVLTSIYLFWIFKGFIRRTICVGLGLVICLAVVVTQARACYVSIPLALALAVLLTKRIKVHWRGAILITIAIFLVSVFVLGGRLTGGSSEQRLASIWEKENVRPILWKGYMDMGLRREIGRAHV